MVLAVGLVMAILCCLPVAAQDDVRPPQEGISAKIARYAKRLVQKYDRDGDRRLRQDEWEQMGGDPRRADANGDGIILFEELARHVANYSMLRTIRLRSPGPQVPFGGLLPVFQPRNEAGSLSQHVTVPAAKQPDRAPKPEPRFHVAPSQLPEGLPSWFVQRDADGDGQISMAEFTQQAPREELPEFSRWDANGDGVVTAQECVRVAKSLPQEQPTGSESTDRPAKERAADQPVGAPAKP
ncbi:MAG: hypothetical protein A2W31_04720 [Planctomycetes bacterium RBG_16_64_10]|nr:MAG: hypothetical protein A2W31_04720 [Planctomycetes bacterium RBG_16_64_10]